MSLRKHRRHSGRAPHRGRHAQNGLRVGLTGVTTHFCSQWEQPANLDGITVTDAFTAAAEAYAELQQQVDLTVCIYHGGFENDLRTGAPLYTTDENQGCRICNELGFDILLAGHQHMPVENLCLNDDLHLPAA